MVTLLDLLGHHHAGLKAAGKSDRSVAACDEAVRFFHRHGVLGWTPADELTLPTLEKVQREAHMAPQSVDVHMRVLRAAFNRAAKSGLVTGELRIPTCRKPRYRHQALTPAQTRAVLRAAQEPFDLAVGLGVYCGLRKQEIRHTRWENVSINPGDGDPYLHVKTVSVPRIGYQWEPKGCKERIVSIPGPLQGSLLLARAGAGAKAAAGWVFPGVKGKPRQDFTRGVGAALAAAKVPSELGRGLHTLRRTYATRLAQQGVAVSVISQLMGHSDISVTQGYICASTPAMAAAAKLLSYDDDDDDGGEG